MIIEHGSLSLSVDLKNLTVFTEVILSVCLVSGLTLDW